MKSLAKEVKIFEKASLMVSTINMSDQLVFDNLSYLKSFMGLARMKDNIYVRVLILSKSPWAHIA